MTEVVRVEDLHKYFGSHEVLRGIDLTVQRGETIVILGSSGSGKSTFLRCLNFLELPTSGRIAIDGVVQGTESGRTNGAPLVRYNERELCKVRARVGMVFQQFNLFPHMNALQNVMEGPVTVLKLGKAEAETRAREELTRVGLGDRADAYPAHLSGGQQQRVAIARALAMQPAVMLFDEVTSALDPELVGEVLRTMRELSDAGMTMLVVTHEIGFAYAVADRVIFLHEGRILEDGPPHQVLVHPRQTRFRDFLTGFAQFKVPDLETR